MSHSDGRKPLAIIGIACRFPKADSPNKFWANIINGVDCISEVPRESHWNPDDYFDKDPKKPDHTYARRGGFLSPVDFDPLEYGIPPTSLEATDTSQLLGMVVAKEALDDAGYSRDRSFNRERISVVLGVTGALELVVPLGARLGHPRWRRAMEEAGIEDQRINAIVDKISASYVPWKEASFPGLLGNVVAGRIANFLDLGGTNCVADAACASALSAIHLATLELETGAADMVVTGGVDTFNDIFMYMCFSKTPALSPSGEVRPFDAAGDGTLLGEGVGMVVLKRLEDAERDGDRIYAVLRGMGSSSDGRGNAIYAPNASGQAKALRRAYENAGVDPATISMVEGHGTGTKVGDGTEISALGSVFDSVRSQRNWCAVGSVKSQIGHTKAAAGVAGLIKAALALDRKIIPPSIKVNRPLEIIENNSPFYLSPQPRPWMPDSHPRRAGVSAFGFGGSNFHAVLEEHQALKTTIDWDGCFQILAFGAADRNQLIQAVRALDVAMDHQALVRFAARSRMNFQKDSAFRLMMVVERDSVDLARLRERALALLESQKDQKHWSAPEGLYFGSGPVSGRLGAIFPGQGSQYPNMMRDLACRFPQMQQVLADVDKAFTAEFHQGRITDYIYPPHSWNPEDERLRARQLQRTEHAQPAIGAVSIGALKVLNSFGIHPQAAAGHSYGEITALCAAERFDTGALALISLLRGKLMAEGDGDRGAMVAVRAPLNEVSQLVDEEGLNLVLANKNAPDQVVLSGPTREIDKAIAIMENRRVSHKRLSVAAAFHSTMVAKASKPFATELQKIDFPKATIPVYSNTTARPYPEDAAEARDLLATQLTRPVEFVAEIENMYRDGVRTFLEIGPGARLTSLVKSILAGRDFEALAVDAGSGKRSGMQDMARVLAHLAALGHPVNLELWEESSRNSAPARVQRGLIFPLTGANYIDPKTKAKAEAKMQLPALPPVQQTRVTAAPDQGPVARVPLPPKPVAATSPALVDALRITQQNMTLLQKMQEETAELHRRFLEGQDQAMQQMQALILQQSQLLGGSTSPAIAPPAPAPLSRPLMDAPPTLIQPPVAPAAPPVVTLPAAPPAPAKSAYDLTAALLAVVSEKTGYPMDMLDTGMSLDADLGIDSIKRVEIMSALQEAVPGAPSIEPDRMGSLQTLQEIIDYLSLSSKVAPGSVKNDATVAPLAGPSAAVLVREIIAEKTGYPSDMLELEMSLDGDLGIDSIKRVEIFSAIQEKLPHAPEIAPDQISQFHNLADIVGFLDGAAPVAVAPVSSGFNPSLIQKVLLAVVAEKTGYPADMLDPAMSLDADLGIDSIKRVEILAALQEAMPQLPAIEPDQMGSLHSLSDIISFLATRSGSPTENAAPAALSMPSTDIQAALFGVIADKTGYPTEMLNLSMNLEADLGIDSIKRVEIFSALSEEMPQLPEIKPDQLGNFSSLFEIVAFLGNSPGVVASSTPPAPSIDLAARLMDIVADKTGYPADMLNLDMNLEGDLGIDSIKRVEIMSALQEAVPGLPELKPDQMGALQTLNQIVAALGSTPPVPVTPTLATRRLDPEKVREDRLERLVVKPRDYAETGQDLDLGEGQILITDDGSKFVKALAKAFRERGFAVTSQKPDMMAEMPENLVGLVILAPETADDHFAEQALMLARAAGRTLNAKGRGFFATVTRMDGRFGFGPKAIANPLQGALSGLSKTAAHEWPQIHCRALDLAPDFRDGRALVDVLLTTGPCELALDTQGRYSLELAVENLEGPAGKRLQPGDTLLVTGGARGVTAEVCVALAGYQPKLVLMGRSPLPEAGEPQWLTGLEDEAAIKKAIAANASTRLKPKELQEEYQRISAAREIRNNIQRMQQAGAEVHYLSTDLRDAEAVAAAVSQVRTQHGAICGLVHGAGVLADRRIEDKTVQQFRSVFGTKVGGLRNLLDSVSADPLKMMVLFSSSTGRFGRTGQVDYAMANEVLNKTAQQQRLLRPDCRVVSVNWGPWDGGMVTPALRRLFADEGIGLIGLNSGSAYLLDELERGQATEVVVLGALEGRPGLGSALTIPVPAPPVQMNSVQDSLEQAFELHVSLEEFPALESHVLDGRAVVPAVLSMEWLAHGAMHHNPGFRYQGIHDFRVLKGIVLEPGQRLKLQVFSEMINPEGDQILVPAQLRSELDGKLRIHASANILLGSGSLQKRAPEAPVQGSPYQQGDQIYQTLFHGPQFQGIKQVTTIDQAGLCASVSCAPVPRQWLTNPLRSVWLADPLALDCAFQLMVLWSVAYFGKPSLPVAVRSFHLHDRFPAPGAELSVNLRVTHAQGSRTLADIEFLDGDRLVARMEGYEAVMDASLEKAYRANRLLASAKS